MKDPADGDQQNGSFFYTIGKPSSSERKVKGSRFIALAFPVASPAECEEILQQQRRKFHDATHVCFAYRIGFGDRALYRYSDAGEPAGTAGQPIYQAIQGRQLTNVLVVVVRYFGGTKLGIGGLIRAYGETAAAALDAAEKVKREYRATLKLRFSYDMLQPVLRGVSAHRGKVARQNYAEDVELSVTVPVSLVERLQEELTNTTSGKIEILVENRNAAP